MDKMPDRLLAVDDPQPVTVSNENGGSPFVIVADHAGNSLPHALGQLGIPQIELGATSPGTSASVRSAALWPMRSTPRWLRRTTHGS
jgi:hypothetical protein